jgi:hypothetical protein
VNDATFILEDPTGWLPPLVCLEDHEGNWQRYLEALYSGFRQDFIYTRPSFSGIPCGVRRHPMTKDMEAGFWHLVSEGPEEAERLPDLRRCERIRWPRPMITDGGVQRVKVWPSRGEEGKRGSRLTVAVADFSYVAILEHAGNHMLLITAYLIERDHQREKYRKSFEAYKRMTPPQKDGASTPSTTW